MAGVPSARFGRYGLIVAGLGEATDLALATGQEAEPDGEREAGVDHRRPHEGRDPVATHKQIDIGPPVRQD